MDFVFKYIPPPPRGGGGGGGRRGIYLQTKSIIIKPDESYLSFLMIPKSEILGPCFFFSIFFFCIFFV